MQHDSFMYRNEPKLLSTRCRGWISVIVFATLGLAVSSSSAQTSQPAASASFKELDQFGNTLEAVQAGEALDTTTPPSPDHPSERPGDEAQLPKSYPNAARIESIHERINLLKKLIVEERIAAESTQPQSPAFTAESEKNTTNQSEPETESTEGDLGAAPEPIQPSDNRDGNLVPPPAKGPTASIPVVGEPVNSFELANSLFLTGNVSAARKSYEARLTEDTTVDDEAWLKCLIGCCYRLEGNFNKAEELFRDVTNLKQDSYPVDYSQWCLQYVANRRVSLEQIQAIESEIDGILKKAGKK